MTQTELELELDAHDADKVIAELVQRSVDNAVGLAALGQDIAELAEKIEALRKTWRALFIDSK